MSITNRIDRFSLSVSYGIISDMGGTIEAATTNDGAALTIMRSNNAANPFS